jgi:transglutaminase-like putative cysteine protease
MKIFVKILILSFFVTILLIGCKSLPEDKSVVTISEKVAQITAGHESEREKAVALHNYVCEEVKFGFTKYFDEATPEYTLNCGIGHCNPKTELMVAFFREAGFEAHQHFCTLPMVVASGINPSFIEWFMEWSNPEVSHSYTEVKVEGNWYSIDSYIVDTPLLKSSLAKLSEEDKSFGYFTRKGATNKWDGQSDSFSQYSKDLMIEDHGRVENPETYYESEKYRNKTFGCIRWNTMNMLMFGGSVALANSGFEELRKQYWNQQTTKND